MTLLRRARFLASTHFTNYDPWLFAVNLTALVLVLIPKLPAVSLPRVSPQRRGLVPSAIVGSPVDMSSSTATACASWWTRSRPASAPPRRPISPVLDTRPPRVAASRYRPSQSARWNRVSDPALPPSFLFRYLCGLIDGALVAATTVIVHLISHIASKGPRNS